MDDSLRTVIYDYVCPKAIKYYKVCLEAEDSQRIVLRNIFFLLCFLETENNNNSKHGKRKHI
jgi:hypothetical protein